MKVPFDPAVHGFQFSNRFIEWSFGPFSGKTLCGGMVYAALDYFIAERAIPRQAEVPPRGNCLNTYIYKRQWCAHKNTAFAFSKHWLINPDSTRNFEKLKRHLSAGKAFPVCLYREIGKGHHTLGIAANSENNISFDVYDPNFPNVVSTITVETGGFRHSVSNRLWKGFFIDDAYKWKTPILSMVKND